MQNLNTYERIYSTPIEDYVCEHPKPWKNTPWGYKVCPKCNDIVEREQTVD